LTINCLTDDAQDKMESTDGQQAHICAVGLWNDNSARVLSLPNLVEMHMEKLADGERCQPGHFFLMAVRRFIQ